MTDQLLNKAYAHYEDRLLILLGGRCMKQILGKVDKEIAEKYKIPDMQIKK